MRDATFRGAVLSCAMFSLGLLATPVAAQNPEDRGSLAFSEWDAGRVSHAGTMIRTRVLFPNDAGPFPLVGVIHGANANGSYHLELARTLASRGFVVLLPDMPCTVTSCDHDANQRQISAMLEWAVALSADSSSMIAGKVDGSRRGLIGHSWGGLSSHITASRDASIDSIVLLDPNDDRGVGLAATPGVRGMTLQLIAEVEGGCNNAWREDMVQPMLPTPNLEVQVNMSGHCDPGEMDVVCSIACGRGDRSTHVHFQRYAVAWTACVLQADPAMASWLGGTDFQGQVSAGTLERVVEAGLDGLPCRGGMLPDAGVPDVDAAVVPGEDAASDVDAAVIPGTDAGSPPGMDAAAPGTDAGATTPPASGGCGCRIGAHDEAPALLPLGALLLALNFRRQRR